MQTIYGLLVLIYLFISWDDSEIWRKDISNSEAVYSNIANKFKNVDESETAVSTNPTKPVDTHDYSRLHSLHNNHFGVAATVGYEFPIGIQINAQYKISLSDIAGFYSENKGKEIADALIYPQSVSLGIAYRWK